MVAGPALFDTNVLIYALSEDRFGARTIIKKAAPYGLAVSVVTWVEVMAGAADTDMEETRRFLSKFEIFGIDPRTADKAAALRRNTRLKVPDAVIYATALIAARTLITFDAEHFSEGMPFVYLPHRTV